MAGCIRGGYKRRLLQTLNSPYINQTPTAGRSEKKKRQRSEEGFKGFASGSFPPVKRPRYVGVGDAFSPGPTM